MSELKVLFADDHIPDFELPPDDKQAIDVVRKHHPGCSASDLADWLKFHKHCKGMIQILKDAAYQVTTVNHFNEAIKKVKNDHFDIAIVDLGWYNDDLFPGGDRGSAGWDICKEIDNRYKKRGGKPTLQIIASDRFKNEKEGPGLLSTAANNGRLPFVKIQDSQVNLEALKACTQFLEKTLEVTSPAGLARRALSELEAIRNKYLDEPLKQLRSWAAAALVCACLGFVIVLMGAVRVVHGPLQGGVLTSLNGVISGAVAALFYRRLEKVQETLSKQLKDLREDIAALWDRIFKLTTPV